MKWPAIFFDKDGTLLKNMPFNVTPEHIYMEPYAEYALAMLARNGGDTKLFVITNQPGVALGYFPTRALKDVQGALERIFARNGVRLAGFYYCPHHPDGRIPRYASHCACRKPAPGLIFQAAHEHHLDLSRSWMIGDILHDVEAGNRAGCHTILLDNGNETEWKLTSSRIPNYIAGNLADATRHVLAQREITWI